MASDALIFQWCFSNIDFRDVFNLINPIAERWYSNLFLFVSEKERVVCIIPMESLVEIRDYMYMMIINRFKFNYMYTTRVYLVCHSDHRGNVNLPAHLSEKKLNVIYPQEQ